MRKTRGVKLHRPAALTTRDLRVRELAHERLKKIPPAPPYDHKKTLKAGLRDGLWEGRPCYIVGGGPSLKGFDWGSLRGYPTIGINRAFEFFDPTIIFSMDTRFWTWIEEGKAIPGDDEKSRWLREKFWNYDEGLKVWLQVTGCKLFPSDIVPVKYCRSSVFGTSLQHGLVPGNNSGYAALNLALVLKANPIYLLGFDMGWRPDREFNPRHKQSHFHNGHPKSQRAGVYDRFIKQFNEAVEKKALGDTEVYNLSPNSRMECFPKKELKIEPSKCPVYISYHTPDSLYTEAAARLKRSLVLQGCRYDIEKVESRGSWQANSSMKAEFILRKMEQYKGTPVVWVDADAVMNKYPVRFESISRRKQAAFHLKGGKELLSGTVWFSNTAKSRQLVQDWRDECFRNPRTWDQVCLANVIKEKKYSYEILEPTYCAIYDSMPEAGEYPHIEHFQASRKARRIKL